MKERGKAEGIDFSYDGVVSQTTDSHRLIGKARLLKGEDGQLRLVERLFKTYFEESGDPGSFELLSRDAETAGVMTKEEVCFPSPPVDVYFTSDRIYNAGSQVPSIR